MCIIVLWIVFESFKLKKEYFNDNNQTKMYIFGLVMIINFK